MQHKEATFDPVESKPDPIDIHVGQRLRQRRMLLGMSQEKLGDAVRLTFQQIQKYERGANRMGASRLFRIAQILSVPVSYFYGDMPAHIAADTNAQAQTGFAEGTGQSALLDEAATPNDLLQKRETLDLVRAFYKITDPKQRRKMLELIKAIAGGESEGA
ncbi:MAG: helix-turn-helix transcriptional regulator [Alphaproteobacteria bacterium]